MRALIFDLDGVVADSEQRHLASYQRVLGDQGHVLSADDYHTNYLGQDDKGLFAAFMAAQNAPASKERIDDMVARKGRVYLELIQQDLVIFPGVCELVRAAAVHHPLAIASGSLRPQIELILERAGICEEFRHISSADDIRRGKPDPEIFLHALAGLNRWQSSDDRLVAADCLVIEDSLPGIRSAHAGMKVLAVANTHLAEELGEAGAIVDALTEVDLLELKGRLWPREALR